LWFTENNQSNTIGYIGKITTAGVITEYIVPTASTYLGGICAGPDGNLWFTESDINQIGKFNIALGTVTNEYTIPTASSSPRGICSGPDGNLWFTEQLGNKIGKITTAGSVTEYPIPTGTASPWGICSGPDGNLWFVENGGNKIGKITTAGVITEYGTANGLSASSSPRGICAGPDGNLWFTEGSTNKIGKITTAGIITEYTVPTAGASPYSICSGPDGNIWFSEDNKNKIGKFPGDSIWNAVSASFEFAPTIPPPVQLDSISVSTGTVSTSTFTPSVNSTIILSVVSAVAQPNLSIKDSWGLNWSNVQKYNSYGQDNVAIYWAYNTSSTPGSITVNDSNSAVNAIQPWAINTQQATAYIGGTVVNNALSGNLSSAPNSNSLVFTIVADRTGYFTPSFVAPSGYTTLVSNNASEYFIRWSAAYRNKNTPQTVSWTDPAAGSVASSPAIAAVEFIPTISSPTTVGAFRLSDATSSNSPVAVGYQNQSTQNYFAAAEYLGAITAAGNAPSTIPAVRQQGDSGTAAIASGSTANVFTINTTIGDAVVLNIVPSSTNANTITEYPVPTLSSTPAFICSGPDGNLWFAENSGNKIGKITTAGSLTEYSTAITANSNPYGICSGPDGNLWFTEINGNKIGKITTAGSVTEYPIPTGTASPYGICSGPDGNLWFTENGGNKIGKITTAGSVTEYTIPTATANPWGICSGPDGNLWFAEYGGNKIGKITTAGIITEYSIPTGTARPRGICSGPDGNIWFTENNTTANKIGVINTAGSVLAEYPIPTALSQPDGICAGPDGNIWFNESNAHKIGKFNIALGTVTNEYTFPTAINQAYGICSGPDGNLWFTAYNTNSSIGKFILPSSVSSVTSPIGSFQKASAIDGSPYSSEMWYGQATGAGTTITVTTSGSAPYYAWGGEFYNLSYFGIATGTASSGISNTTGIIFDVTTFDSAANTANFDQNNGTAANVVVNNNNPTSLTIAGINATSAGITPGSTYTIIAGTPQAGWGYYNLGGFSRSLGRDVAIAYSVTSPANTTPVWNISSAYLWDMSAIVLSNWNGQYYFGAMTDSVNMGANW
jgi:streptogramin lyase